MADDNMVLYTAVYEDVDDALSDLDALSQLHDDKFVGRFDAAVIDKDSGRPQIVKRLDRPRIRAIPEAFGSGTLPRKELKEAADELTDGDAGLIAAGEPTLERAFDTAVTRAARIIKRSVDATTDEVASELMEAAGGR